MKRASNPAVASGEAFWAEPGERMATMVIAAAGPPVSPEAKRRIDAGYTGSKPETEFCEAFK